MSEQLTPEQKEEVLRLMQSDPEAAKVLARAYQRNNQPK